MVCSELRLALKQEENRTQAYIEQPGFSLPVSNINMQYLGRRRLTDLITMLLALPSINLKSHQFQEAALMCHQRPMLDSPLQAAKLLKKLMSRKINRS